MNEEQQNVAPEEEQEKKLTDEEQHRKSYDDFVKSNLEEAKKECEKGNPTALLTLACHYYNPYKEDYDPQEAYHLFYRLNSLGNDNAIPFLINMYLRGIGTEKNVEMALSLLQQYQEDKEIREVIYEGYIEIYLLEKEYYNFDKVNQYFKEYFQIVQYNDEVFDKVDPVTSEAYPDPKEFKYQFDKREKLHEKFRNLRSVLSLLEDDPKGAYALLDESYAKDSIIYTKLIAYFYLNGFGVEQDIEKAKEIYKKSIEISEDNLIKQIRKVDLPDYVPFFEPSSKDQLIYPEGYIYYEKEAKAFLEEEIEKAEYDIVPVLAFLVLAYMGKYKYIEADGEKALMYCNRGIRLGEVYFKIWKAMLLDDGYLEYRDHEAAIDLITESLNDFNDAHLYLADILVKDEKYEDAAEVLLKYSRKEMETDVKEVERFDNHKEEIEENDPFLAEKMKEAMKPGVEETVAAFELFDKGDFKAAKDYFQKAYDHSMSEAQTMLAYYALKGLEQDQDIPRATELVHELKIKYIM